MLEKRTPLICTFLFGWISLFGNEGTKWITADLKDLESSAQDGDSYAQAFLALCYIHGDKGLNISFDKASYWANLSTETCLLYTSPSPRDLSTSRMPSSA